jgi:hypothetical protein
LVVDTFAIGAAFDRRRFTRPAQNAQNSGHTSAKGHAEATVAAAR